MNQEEERKKKTKKKKYDPEKDADPQSNSDARNNQDPDKLHQMPLSNPHKKEAQDNIQQLDQPSMIGSPPSIDKFQLPLSMSRPIRNNAQANMGSDDYKEPENTKEPENNKELRIIILRNLRITIK